MLALNIPRDIVKPNADGVSVLARVGTLAALKKKSQLAERRSDRASSQDALASECPWRDSILSREQSTTAITKVNTPP